MAHNGFSRQSTIDTSSKRQQILDAAYIVFSRKGYHRATVDEIIHLADTGKGTVYNYFENKEQLFYTLIKERSAPFEKALAQTVKSDMDPLEKISKVIKIFLEFYNINADLWRVMMHEVRGLGSEGYSNFKPEQREKYHTWFRNTIGMLESVISEGISAGLLKNCDVTKAAYGLFSVIAMMVFQKLVNDDIEQTARTVADIFLYGVAKNR